MSRIYTESNKIRFTDISVKYKVKQAVKGKLSELHAMLITYVVSNFKNTKKYKQKVVDALNIITYALYSDEPLPFNWSPNSPFHNFPDVSDDMIQEVLGDVYLTVDSILWDVEETDSEIVEDVEPEEVKSETIIKKEVQPEVVEVKDKNVTDKKDLYIQSPAIPQFDYNRIWMSGEAGGDNLVIYVTLPEIPTKQNEISVTTDVDKMTYEELIKLYPNTVINTRSPIMYEKRDDMDWDDNLGVIIPVDGFTVEQVKDNIVRYPHLYKLSREVDGNVVNFYTDIEIDGELKKTLEVWETLEISKKIPRQAEFVKEYVVRKYLLERDINNVEYRYPMFGELNPFLTLFMPPEKYKEYGYSDIEQLARDCVNSRVSYKRSRNPIMRRLKSDA